MRFGANLMKTLILHKDYSIKKNCFNNANTPIHMVYFSIIFFTKRGACASPGFCHQRLDKDDLSLHIWNDVEKVVFLQRDKLLLR